jgi:hypothetical protein
MTAADVRDCFVLAIAAIGWAALGWTIGVREMKARERRIIKGVSKMIVHNILDLQRRVLLLEDPKLTQSMRAAEPVEEHHAEGT